MNDIDHRYTANRVCPYCGYEDIDSWSYEVDSECTEAECKKCDLVFSVETHEITYYSTEKKAE